MRSMTNSYIQIWIHIVFSTKKRTPFLVHTPLRQMVFRYLANTARRMGVKSVTVGGMEDHVHLLIALAKTISIADFVKELKRNSSIWAKKQDPSLEGFSWQKGYGAFSVSHSGRHEVIRYIQNQEQHHRGLDFFDEYSRLFALHEVDFDVRYLFD